MEVFAIILFCITSVLLFRLIAGCGLKYMAREGNIKPLTIKEVIISTTVLIAVCMLPYYLLAKSHVCSTNYIMISLLVSILLCIAAHCRLSKHKELTELYKVQLVLSAIAICSVFNLGIIFFSRWMLPDVTMVRVNNGRYEVSTRYANMFSKNFKLTGSYLENNTQDMLYRVVVSYALLGKEIRNHYNVTDTIMPSTTAVISCTPNYVARSIFPVMLPTTGRFGQSRTRMSYIVTGNELEVFMTSDFSCFGIKENIRKDSFDITRNPIVWEDPHRIELLERTLDRVYREYHRDK